ncbi:MAG: ATP-binding cassette domain-containing protein [Acidimicrobiales bacterium]
MSVPVSSQVAESAIQARDLVKTYPGKPPTIALRGLSFSVTAGTVFGLLGPNGAGKSTTVKILTTLSRPDSGSAVVAGVDVLRHPEAARRLIGCVAQKHGSDPQATGRENLMLQGHIYGMRGAPLKRRVDLLLERFDLGQAARRVVRTYSGGMQRKLDVALGLVHQPKVLFLDEPTTGLDPEARADMWAEITALSAHEGVTVLLTTHYLEEADRLAEQLVIVDHGAIVAQGTPDELKAELHGDAIVLEVMDEADIGAAIGIVSGLEGMSEVVGERRTIRARVASGATAVPVVLSVLSDKQIEIAAVTLARPSLDDVYLRHTGHRYQASDGSDGEGR